MFEVICFWFDQRKSRLWRCLDDWSELAWIFTILFLRFLPSFSLIGYIKHSRQRLTTPQSSSKTLRSASYVQLSSQSLQLWSNTVFRVQALIKIKGIQVTWPCLSMLLLYSLYSDPLYYRFLSKIGATQAYICGDFCITIHRFNSKLH